MSHSLYFKGDKRILSDDIKTLIEPGIKQIGYELVSIKFEKVKNEYFLRIIVDRDEPIDLDAIEQVSNTISSTLDASDPIPYQYMLDISSLGAEKPINIGNLEKYIGKYMWVHLSDPYKGENIIEGFLDSINEEEATILYKIKSRVVKATIPVKNIDKAHLAIKL